MILSVMVSFSTPGDLSGQGFAASSREAAFDVAKAYLRATRARDFETAYRHISSIDQRIRDKNTYIRSQENYSGFSLDLSRRLAAAADVWMIEQKLGSTKAQLELGYRTLTADEMPYQLHRWNQEKLNALPPAEQAALLKSIDKLKDSGKGITIEGRETFDLVLEKDGWKIFLDWPSQHRILFKTSRLASEELAVRFSRNDFLVKPEEPFQVDFKIANRTNRELVVKLHHVVEPRTMEKLIDMIACGLLTRFSLRPRETQEFSSAYVLRGNVSRKRALAIAYDFAVMAAPAKQRISQMAVTPSK